MKCRKTGPKPLFEIELLSKAMLQTQAVFDQRKTAISFILLTDANDCFSFLIIFSVMKHQKRSRSSIQSLNGNGKYVLFHYNAEW